jgi:DNA-binding MarR family transcriptional regulator
MQMTAELSRRMGYELKRAQAALRAAMDAALRRHGLTVPQYACLELLDQRPGLSNAELARGAFVTRQSMNVVLRGLQDSGLVTRPPQAPHGRALPARLTAAGQHRLAAARATIIAIEQHMTAALPPQRAASVLADLGRMAQALESPQRPPRAST